MHNVFVFHNACCFNVHLAVKYCMKMFVLDMQCLGVGNFMEQILWQELCLLIFCLKDCSAFALQSLLQVYRIEPMEIGLTECRGNKLWCRMSVQFQEILAPLLHTKLVLLV